MFGFTHDPGRLAGSGDDAQRPNRNAEGTLAEHRGSWEGQLINCVIKWIIDHGVCASVCVCVFHLAVSTGADATHSQAVNCAGRQFFTHTLCSGAAVRHLPLARCTRQTAGEGLCVCECVCVEVYMQFNKTPHLFISDINQTTHSLYPSQHTISTPLSQPISVQSIHCFNGTLN